MSASSTECSLSVSRVRGRRAPDPEPTVRFAGGREEGFRALAVALRHRFPVQAVRRYWAVIDGEPSGPNWEMTFWRGAS